MLHDINYHSVIMSLVGGLYLHQSKDTWTKRSFFDETIKRPHSSTKYIIGHFVLFIHKCKKVWGRGLISFYEYVWLLISARICKHMPYKIWDKNYLSIPKLQRF